VSGYYLGGVIGFARHAPRGSRRAAWQIHHLAGYPNAFVFHLDARPLPAFCLTAQLRNLLGKPDLNRTSSSDRGRPDRSNMDRQARWVVAGRDCTAVNCN
jgi:hypothetical protein